MRPSEHLAYLSWPGMISFWLNEVTKDLVDLRLWLAMGNPEPLSKFKRRENRRLSAKERAACREAERQARGAERRAFSATEQLHELWRRGVGA